MERFIQAIQQAVRNKNWYAALALALTLPDICGRLSAPKKKSGKRYAAWWDEFVQHRYASSGHVFLSGGDAYALRCAYLHEGRDDVAEQRARQALSRFVFIEPPSGGNRVHCNQFNDVLQLQVDIFCEDVCAGASEWLRQNESDEEIRGRMSALISIRLSNAPVAL